MSDGGLFYVIIELCRKPHPYAIAFHVAEGYTSCQPPPMDLDWTQAEAAA